MMSGQEATIFPNSASKRKTIVTPSSPIQVLRSQVGKEKPSGLEPASCPLRLNSGFSHPLHLKQDSAEERGGAEV